MDNLCLQPLFLRVLYLSGRILNILRFVVPILLIIKVILDVYKQVINPNNEEGKKHIINRIIASILVFFTPTLIGLLFSFIETVISSNSYNDLKVCQEFANLEYINILEENIEQEKLELYLSERDKNLSAYEQKIEAIRKIVESNKMSAEVGEYANNHNKIACGSGSNYNTGLFNAVRSAGYKTREGVVAAALYLSSHIDVHIPYFWSGGHNHTYDNYEDKGNNLIGVSNKWGCDVKMKYGGTDKQKNGVAYPFGMDCSGFVAWSILNGGYYTGDSSQKITVSTGSNPSSSVDGVSVSSVKASSAKGKIKPGDVAFKSGHVGMVVEVHEDYYMVAEEMGYDYGLVVSKVKYGSRFTDIVLMDNFYNNYKKGVPLWNGFK